MNNAIKYAIFVVLANNTVGSKESTLLTIYPFKTNSKTNFNSKIWIWSYNFTGSETVLYSDFFTLKNVIFEF